MKRGSMHMARRLTGDGGSAVVEAALVLPVVASLLLGTFELGIMLKNSVTVTNSIRSAARTDANVLSFTARRYADYSALDTLRVSSAGTTNSTVLRVVIYKPVAADGSPPALCLSTATNNSGAGVNNQCNIFNQYQMTNLTPLSFGASAASASCVGGEWDRYWCPTSRSNTLAAGLDTVCIYVAKTYTYVTRIFPGGSRTVTDRACVQVEPKV